MSRDFFAEKRGAAVLKHGILARYSKVFAGKTGSRTDGGRVVFLDGYAGPGRYEDGQPGSPLLFMETAQTAGTWRTLRQIQPIFVERDPQHYAKLCEVLTEQETTGIKPMVVSGDLGHRLPELLPLADGASLLVFLDPFGTALDRRHLRALLRRPRWPPTEVLLHVSVSTVARIGGIVRSARRTRRELTPAESKTVARVDRFLGGHWWQRQFRGTADLDDGPTATDVALEIAVQFCRMLALETKRTAVPMPVRPQPGQLPKYVLTLFTEHPDGAWAFTDAVGRAGMDWQRAYHDREAAAEDTRRRERDEQTGQFGLFDPPPKRFDPDTYEREHRAGWVRDIEQNIRRLVTQHGNLVLGDRAVEVYGDRLGHAWETHVRAALNNLRARGVIDNDGRSRNLGRRVVREVSLPTQQAPSAHARGADPTSGLPESDHQPSASDRPTA